MNPLAKHALLSRSRWLLYLLMLLFCVVALPLQAATLNIAKPGSGSGTVASNPAAISCGTDCTGSYGAGAAVTLIATPDAASSFVGWSAGICAGQNSVCALNMTATDQTVAAYFAGASVVAGGWHSLGLTSYGTVWAWGRNTYGQLGDGSTTTRSTPVQVSGLSGVIAIAGGDIHSLALKSDGTVWAWGYNYYGQLGDGSTTTRSTPVQVSGLSGVIAIAGGGDHNLALKSDGTVWAWGDNTNGELGDGSTTTRSTPVQTLGAGGSGFLNLHQATSPAVASRQTNIATRGWAGTGDSVMIAGFVISGDQPKKVLITAKGPVLATAGVPSVLADPNLTLYNSAGQPFQFNDNWQSASNASEVAALGRGMRADFPQEAALLTTLFPGAYTAIVRGAGTTAGNALVEVFDQD